MTEIKEIGDFVDYRPPSWDRLFMRLAYEYASKSKDPSSKIGAVIVKGNRPILFGYNGFPEGVNDNLERLCNRELKLYLTEHAERNAVDMAASLGISSKGGILYTQIMPCSGCAKAILQANVCELVLHKPANDYFEKCFTGHTWKKEHEMSNLMFSEKGLKIRWMDECVDSVGYFGGKKVSV